MTYLDGMALPRAWRSARPRQARPIADGGTQHNAAPDATIAGRHVPGREPATGEVRGCRGSLRGHYYYYFGLRLPYRRSNRSMRPPVSTSFCLPV
jgi:hypothetical protein